MRPDGLFLLLIFVSIPWVLGWIAKTHWAHQRQMKALELRAEANTRLFDRLGSDPALIDLVKSDAQRHLFDVASQEPNRSLPYTRMLTSLQASFLLLSAGIACLWARTAFVNQNGRDGFTFFGALGVALGIGSLFSAAAALIVGRMWRRLHDGDGDGRSASPTGR